MVAPVWVLHTQHMKGDGNIGVSDVVQLLNHVLLSFQLLLIQMRVIHFQMFVIQFQMYKRNSNSLFWHM